MFLFFSSGGLGFLGKGPCQNEISFYPVSPRQIILAFSSELKSPDARSVSVEQMKVDIHDQLDLMMNNWLLSIDNIIVS